MHHMQTGITTCLNVTCAMFLVQFQYGSDGFITPLVPILRLSFYFHGVFYVPAVFVWVFSGFIVFLTLFNSVPVVQLVILNGLQM